MHKINFKHVGKHNRRNTPVLGTGIIAKGLGSTRLKNPQLGTTTVPILYPQKIL